MIVCCGFAAAGYLIGKSYKEWQKNPISTSITTRPIDDLDFPIVTVCPPKDPNTALYHDLVKAGNRTLSDKDKYTLKEAAFKIFIEKSHKEYVKQMLAISNGLNMDPVFKGLQSLPKPDMSIYANAFKILMWSQNGTIATPWFGEHYVEDYYKEDHAFHIVLEFPEDVKELIGSGTLAIDLEVDI